MSSKQPDIPVTVRPAKPGEEQEMNAFWAGVNGDLGMYDYRAYMRLDPSYLLVAEDDQGQLLGYGGLSEHTPDVVYLGNFIVREDVRGRGVGRQIWKAMLEKAGTRNIALDSEPYMEEWYEKQGFVHKTYKVLFYNVKVTEDMKTDVPKSYAVKTLTDDMWSDLLAYDRLVYPDTDREKILRAWLVGDEVRTVVAYDGSRVVGYGSMHRKETEQYGLRNVFADSEAVLVAMLRDMFRAVPAGWEVRFMKVEGKAMPAYLAHSVYQNDSALRMFNKFPVRTNVDRIWFGTAHIV